MPGNTPVAPRNSLGAAYVIKHGPFNYSSTPMSLLGHITPPPHARTNRGPEAVLYLHALRVSIRLRGQAGHRKGPLGKTRTTRLCSEPKAGQHSRPPSDQLRPVKPLTYRNVGTASRELLHTKERTLPLRTQLVKV